MKKLLLLCSLILLFNTACEKDAATPDTPSEFIKGEWTCLNITTNFYDQNGNLVHKEVSGEGWVFRFGDKSLKMFEPLGAGQLGELFSGEYLIVQEKEKAYINVKSSSGSSDPLEITSISASRMTWVQETVPVYSDGNDNIKAHRAIQTNEFIRN